MTVSSARRVNVTVYGEGMLTASHTVVATEPKEFTAQNIDVPAAIAKAATAWRAMFAADGKWSSLRTTGYDIRIIWPLV